MERITEFRGKYLFLSNFFEHPVTMPDGITYRTAENAFQAMKTEDLEERRKIAAMTARDAKVYGRRSLTLPADWNKRRDDVMLTVILMKFVGTDLEARLLDTGDAELIEGNGWNDTYWGVCRGNGLNKLGQTLMKVRDGIRQHQALRPEADVPADQVEA